MTGVCALQLHNPTALAAVKAFLHHDISATALWLVLRFLDPTLVDRYSDITQDIHRCVGWLT